MKKDRIHPFSKTGRVLGALVLGIGPVTPPTPVERFGEQVKKDVSAVASNFVAAGTKDLSGQGFSACTINSDCLVGREECVAGTKINTRQQPGFCVPVSKK